MCLDKDQGMACSNKSDSDNSKTKVREIIRCDDWEKIFPTLLVLGDVRNIALGVVQILFQLYDFNEASNLYCFISSGLDVNLS